MEQDASYKQRKTSWVKCNKCGSYISMDTDYQYIECACGTIAVDGGELYTRIIGNEENWSIVPDNKKEN
jgi:hypothetical protein